MSDPAKDAAASVTGLVEQLGVKIDPALVVVLGTHLLGVLMAKDPWAEAFKLGLIRAAKVTDVASAEAAAVERNR